MDRTEVSGTSGVGSIPSGATINCFQNTYKQLIMFKGLPRGNPNTYKMAFNP